VLRVKYHYRHKLEIGSREEPGPSSNCDGSGDAAYLRLPMTDYAYNFGEPL
jgi:hypothetical protein